MTPTQQPRVLIVDDEESICTTHARLLQTVGYDVSVANDGPRALNMVETQGPFDVFVIDVAMPIMSGVELARRLRVADPEAKVLYCTGYSDRLFAEKTVLWQHEAFIDKPVTFSMLCEAVSMVLFGHTRGPRTAS